MEMRVACKKAFAQTDCSKRVASAILRKAAPKPMDYAVGDMISFKRKQGSKRRVDKLWSTPTRLIGFEGEKTAWGVCAKEFLYAWRPIKYGHVQQKRL